MRKLNLAFKKQTSSKTGYRNQRWETKSESSKKSNKCTMCGNKTYQKNGVCVICENNINQIYKELIALLPKHRKKSHTNGRRLVSISK